MSLLGLGMVVRNQDLSGYFGGRISGKDRELSWQTPSSGRRNEGTTAKRMDRTLPFGSPVGKLDAGDAGPYLTNMIDKAGCCTEYMCMHACSNNARTTSSCSRRGSIVFLLTGTSFGRSMAVGQAIVHTLSSGGSHLRK